MSLPDTVGEDEFLRVTAQVAKALYRKLASLHGTADDFAQQVVVWSLEALPKYDPARSLDGYLFTVAKSRAMNAIRDKVTRNDPPCRSCHAGTPCGADGRNCPEYSRWRERNQAKANLARPLGLSEMSDSCERGLHADSTVESAAEGRELADLIDRSLPLALRPDYLRLLASESVPKPRRERVQSAVQDILDHPGGYAVQKVSVPPEEPDADFFDSADEDE